MKHQVFAIFPGTQAQRDAMAAIDADGSLASGGAGIHRTHAIVADNASNAGCIYAATWDGKAPYVVLQLGTISALNMCFLGWPMIDQVAWQAANP
jgi:hypothetical protein